MRKALEYISWTGLSVSFMLLGASVVHNYYKPDLTIKRKAIETAKTTTSTATTTTTTTITTPTATAIVNDKNKKI